MYNVDKKNFENDIKNYSSALEKFWDTDPETRRVNAFKARKALDNFFLAARENPNFAIIGPYIQETKNNISSEEIKKGSYPVKSVKGFAMFLNLKQFEDLGFFDENFFIYFEFLNFI